MAGYGTHIKGSAEFKARLKAIRTDVIKPLAAQWQDETVKLARERVPNRNTRYSKGTLHDSIRPGETKSGRRARSALEARILMYYTGYFVDAGTQGGGTNSRASRLTARRGISGQQATRMGLRAVFARNARKGGGYAARPFRTRSAQDALRKVPMAETLVKAWNKAA